MSTETNDPEPAGRILLSKEELEALEYVCPMVFSNGRNAAIQPFLWTWAILADLSEDGYIHRWCYSTLADAVGALSDWDGDGEPQGWHRHLPSGRRRDHEGNDLGVW